MAIPATFPMSGKPVTSTFALGGTLRTLNSMPPVSHRDASDKTLALW
jgi:hypothetical protein